VQKKCQLWLKNWKHHEKWDGSGYLEVKRGNEIPLVARILAVVDTYL